MFRRRALCLLLSLCIICSGVSGSAFAAEYKTIDELGIDPWGDLQQIGGSSDVYTREEDVKEYDLLPEGGEPVPEIVPFTLIRPGSGRGASWYFNSSVTLNTGLGGSKNNPAKSKGQGTGTNSQTAANVQYAKITEADSGVSDTRAQFWRGGSGAAPNVVIQLLAEPLKAVDELKIYGDFTFSLVACCTSDAQTYVVKSWDYSSIVSISVIDTNNTVLYSYSGSMNHAVYTEESPLVVNCHSNDILSIAFTLKPVTTVINNSNDKLQTTAGSTIKTSAYWEARNTSSNITFISSSSASEGTDMTETNGLISSIIGWLQTIVNGIGNIGSAIAALPGKIATAIIDGIKSLFIPSEEELTAIQEQYKSLLSERLGFVWQAGELVTDFVGDILAAFQSDAEYSFQFPGISVPLPELGTVQIAEPQEVSLDNAVMDVLRPVCGTIVSLIAVLAFVHLAETMVIAIISGKSYFDWLKGDGGGEDR